jgi:type I restriction enzyme S subunit
LYQKDFIFFHFPVPPIPEQQKIASILSNLDLLIQQEKQYKEKLEKIKRGLMQQLLTGQKRVKV